MTKINSGRRVVTGGYREPDGTIIEEVQYIPDVVDTVVANNTTTNNTQSTKSGTKIFSPLEEFQLQAEGYDALGDNAMSKVYGDMANSLGQYSSYANSTLGAYDSLLNFISGNEKRLQSAAGKLYGELAGDIRDQKNYVYSMFGPNGTLTKEVNTYYDDLGNYLATDAGRQAAKIAAQGMHSGASLGAIRAQQNEAYNQSFARYVQAKEQEINAKQQIATNLINFMSTLRREYGDTTNQYIIELYKRANDLYNNVASSAMTDLNNYAKLRLSGSGGGGSSSSSLESVGLTPRGDGTYVDNAGNAYDSNGTLISGVIKGGNNTSGSSVGRKHTDTSTAKGRLRILNNELQKSDANGFVKALGNLGVAGSYILPNSFYEMIGV